MLSLWFVGTAPVQSALGTSNRAINFTRQLNEFIRKLSQHVPAGTLLLLLLLLLFLLLLLLYFTYFLLIYFSVKSRFLYTFPCPLSPLCPISPLYLLFISSLSPLYPTFPHLLGCSIPHSSCVNH